MQKIVVAYDGSEHADRALDRAVELAGPEDELIVVCAAYLPESTVDPLLGVETSDPETVAWMLGALERAQERVAGKGVRVRAVEGHGAPADAIIERASMENANLIVVGTRGRGAAGRALLGSVSTSIVHHAPCDVLVVR